MPPLQAFDSSSCSFCGGRWEERYTAGYDSATGKRIIKNILGKIQAEVKVKLSQAVENAKALDVSRTDDYTVLSWLRTWYELYSKPMSVPALPNTTAGALSSM